jgi:hypothetical protein
MSDKPENVLAWCHECGEWKHRTQFRFRGDHCSDCRMRVQFARETQDLLDQKMEYGNPLHRKAIYVVSRGSTHLLDLGEEK